MLKNKVIKLNPDVVNNNNSIISSDDGWGIDWRVADYNARFFGFFPQSQFLICVLQVLFVMSPIKLFNIWRHAKLTQELK